MAELPKDKTSSRMEVVIPITITGIVRGLKKICVDQPIEYLGVAANHTERFSQKLMSGHLAVLTMPVGIILRNGARTVLGSTSEEKSAWWGGFSSLSGVVGAGAGWWLAGKALAATFGAGVIGSTVGTWGAIAAAGIVTFPLVLPAFGAAFIGGSLLAGAVVSVLSLVPAVANIGVSLTRTLDAWKGIKYDDTVLQSDKSLSQKLKERRDEKVLADFYSLPSELRTRAFKDMQRGYATRLEPEALIDSLSPQDQTVLLETLRQRFGQAADSTAPAKTKTKPAADIAPPRIKGH